MTVVLAHGAGASMDSRFMAEAAAGLGARSWCVARFEFPYMLRRRDDGKKRPPDRQQVLEATWQEVIAELGPQGLVIGGKSMGGRMASLVADDSGVAGLLCFGYPFHPPGRPDKTRIDHLRRLATPTLIAQGTRDPFGNGDEVANYPLDPAIAFHWAPDGNHDLAPRKRSGNTAEGNLGAALDAADRFLRSLLG
ncbi:alpha/beta family hydrolase [Thiohalorhabdus sp.]|uniref:alpha/beta family hydrolase n=1 Tax=Thiohalorhabdus sp. TaxID=3094134 RepID=UPI002FC36876